jgi:hypothetical protein
MRIFTATKISNRMYEYQDIYKTGGPDFMTEILASLDQHRQNAVCIYIKQTKKKKLHGLSPRVTDPYGRILGFLNRSRCFSIK